MNGKHNLIKQQTMTKINNNPLDFKLKKQANSFLDLSHKVRKQLVIKRKPLQTAINLEKLSFHHEIKPDVATPNLKEIMGKPVIPVD